MRHSSSVIESDKSGDESEPELEEQIGMMRRRKIMLSYWASMKGIIKSGKIRGGLGLGCLPLRNLLHRLV